MSVPTWFIFPCEIYKGSDGEGPLQTEWSGKCEYAYNWEEAYSRAQRLVNEERHDFAIIMQYVEGKGLELYGTFGFRPAKNDYDFPATRADGFLLVRKFAERVLQAIPSNQINEGM
jgi:hypothetical protein